MNKSSSFTYRNISTLISHEITIVDSYKKQLELKIKEVNRNPFDKENDNAFSVILEGSGNIHAPQGTYTCKHEVFGEEILFISPKSESEYEIIINKLSES